MRTRALLISVVAVASLSACGSDPDHRTSTLDTSRKPPAEPTHTSPTNNAPSTSAPSASTATLRPDPASPAVAKYGSTIVTAALDLASRLARASVTDKQLLATPAAHESIDDYAGITPYLTQQGISFLRSYIRDQTVNDQHFRLTAQLALASVKVVRGGTSNTRGTLFVKPFNPIGYRATLNQKVTLGNDQVTMVVTGKCSVSYAVVQQRKPKTVTFTRTRFTYYVQPQASGADARVGVSGWQSDSTARYTAR